MEATAGGTSIHEMALQLLQYFSPADKIASLAVTPRFGSLYYQAESANPETLPPAPLLENRPIQKKDNTFLTDNTTTQVRP